MKVGCSEKPVHDSAMGTVAEPEVANALAPDDVQHRFLAGASAYSASQLVGPPDDVGVVAAGQTTVAGDEQDAVNDAGSSQPGEHRVLERGVAAQRAQRPRQLGSVYGRAAFIRFCALTMRDAAMSSIALVIFLVDWTERIRRR